MGICANQSQSMLDRVVARYAYETTYGKGWSYDDEGNRNWVGPGSPPPGEVPWINGKPDYSGQGHSFTPKTISGEKAATRWKNIVGVALGMVHQKRNTGTEWNFILDRFKAPSAALTSKQLAWFNSLVEKYKTFVDQTPDYILEERVLSPHFSESLEFSPERGKKVFDWFAERFEIRLASYSWALVGPSKGKPREIKLSPEAMVALGKMPGSWKWLEDYARESNGHVPDVMLEALHKDLERLRNPFAGLFDPGAPVAPVSTPPVSTGIPRVDMTFSPAAISAIEALAARTKDNFVLAMASLVKSGKQLTENQLKAIRAKFHQFGQHAQADMFRP